MIVAMVVFLLFRLLVTLVSQAVMLKKASSDAEAGWAIAGMIFTGLAAFCVIYLASC